MRIAIVTDSSALVPADDAERLGIGIVPVGISLDGEPLDVSTLDVDAFFERLARGAAAATSQPSPGDFDAEYERLAAGGADEILSVHMDGRLSGTIASAELAARKAVIPVTVLDTGTVSFGVAVCARAAAEAAAAGGTIHELTVFVRWLASNLRNVFVAAATRGGRLAPATAWNVLEFKDAIACPLAVCADAAEAVAAMRATVSAQDSAIQVAVGHGTGSVEPAADTLAEALGRLPRVVAVERYRVGPAVGAHTGPLTFGAFWWPAVSESYDLHLVR